MVLYAADFFVWFTRGQTKTEERYENMSKETTIKYKGEVGNIRYFSEKYGIDYSVLKGRITKKWPVEKAIEQPVEKKQKGKITYNGVTRTIKEWSLETGIPQTVITTRLYCKHWNVERALTVKPEKRMKRKTGKNEHLITFNGETHNILEWSKITGIERSTIHARLAYGWTIEKTLTTPNRKYTTSEK